ncbi:MAG TPA: hypothetical protein VM925_13565 [Labilithrix sp.]|nr:hypothetical protein [Labilithrix sp.]
MDASHRDPDAEIAELIARIAEVRAAIADVKAHRERVERSVEPLPSSDPANDVLREKIAAARRRLDELAGMQRKRSRSAEMSIRNALTITGAGVALPGVVTLGLLLWETVKHPEEKTDPILFLVSAAPFVLGLALVLRARFAKYRADKHDLDGDFL